MTPPVSAAEIDLVWPDGRSERAVLGPVLAEGGDARVRALESRPGLVAKVYRDAGAEPRRRAKLRAMLARPPAGALGGGPEVQLAWPLALLEGDLETARGGSGPPAGFVMPRVDLEAAADLELLLSRRARRAAGLPEGYRFRVSVAANLAALVAALHDQGHYVVDLKPTNVHVYRASGRVALLDCDGFSIAGLDGERFGAHQYTDGYIAPEALRSRTRPEALGEAQDRFALAAVVFRLLNGGLHPFQGVPRPGTRVPTTNGERVAAGLYPYAPSRSSDSSPPPGSAHDLFDARTRVLFDAAFAAGPARRPSAEDWWRHLRSLLEDVLRPCGRSEDHARFGRNPCPQCRLQRATPGEQEVSDRAMDRVQDRSPSVAAPTKPVVRRPAPPVVAPASASTGPTALEMLVGFAILMALSYLFLTVLDACVGPSSDAPAAPGQAAFDPGPDYDPNEALRSALLFGRLAEATYALEAGADARMHSAPRGYPYEDQGYQALGAPEMLDRIERDVPPVYAAARGGFPAMLPMLLEYGGGVDQRGPLLRTPLAVAAWSASPSVVLSDSSVGAAALLAQRLAAGAREVAYFRDPETVEAEWTRRVRMTASDDPFPTLLESFGWSGSAYDARSAPDSVLVPASQLLVGVASARILLEAGALPNERDGWGRSPLTYAAAARNPVAVRVLLEAGASPDAADVAGVTPLMVAADAASDPASDALAAATVRELLRGGADPGVRDQAGRTAADYVGDRPATRRVEAWGDTTYVPDDPLGQSVTLAVLRAARDGGEVPDASGLDAAPTAAPSRRADLADGGARFSDETGAPAPPDTPRPPWTRAGVLEVECYVGPDEPVEAEVPVALRRTDRFRVGKLYRFSAPDEVADCRNSIHNALLGTYDLGSAPERWPTGTVRVRVARP